MSDEDTIPPGFSSTLCSTGLRLLFFHEFFNLLNQRYSAGRRHLKMQVVRGGCAAGRAVIEGGKAEIKLSGADAIMAGKRRLDSLQAVLGMGDDQMIRK